jgi:hypothetical protein
MTTLELESIPFSSSWQDRKKCISTSDPFLMSPPSNPQNYHVGWICAVQTEYVLACEILDEEYPTLPNNSPHGDNIYTFGRIGHYEMVIACLQEVNMASRRRLRRLRIYAKVFHRFGMIVGIEGDTPIFD